MAWVLKIFGIYLWSVFPCIYWLKKEWRNLFSLKRVIFCYDWFLFTVCSVACSLNVWENQVEEWCFSTKYSRYTNSDVMFLIILTDLNTPWNLFICNTLNRMRGIHPMSFGWGGVEHFFSEWLTHRTKTSWVTKVTIYFLVLYVG